jgi:hypothetical protein
MAIDPVCAARDARFGTGTVYGGWRYTISVFSRSSDSVACRPPTPHPSAIWMHNSYNFAHRYTWTTSRSLSLDLLLGLGHLAARVLLSARVAISR